MVVIVLYIFLKIFASLFGIILIATLWWYVWYYSYMIHLKDYPQVPHIVPFLGHSLHMSTSIDIYNKLKLYHAKLGSIFVIFGGLEPILVVADADLVQFILTSQKYIDKSKLYNFMRATLGQGLVTSGGEKWQSRRKIITPAFDYKILQQFVGRFDSTGDILVAKLKNEIGKEATDVHHFTSLSSLDAICESVAGTIPNAQENGNSPFVKSIKELSRIITARTTSTMEYFECTYRFSKNYSLEKSALKIVRSFTNSIIAKRKAELLSKHEKNGGSDITLGSKRNVAMLDFLLKYDGNGRVLSNEDIREEVDTLLVAGSETVASTISFALYMLAKYPGIQRRAFEEIKDLVGDDKDRKLSFQDLHEMKYLELVIKETLRMYPVGTFLGRELRENITYGKTIIPKGVTIAIMPMLLQMDEKYFPNPGKFDPERFLPENSEGRHPYSYIPFSAGPRNCIGQKYGMLSIKSTLAKMLTNFEFFPVQHDMELAIEPLLKSKNGVMVQIRSRE